MSIYLDSSFLVSLYVTDVHSAEARRRVQEAPAYGLTPLHFAEWAHALAQHECRGNLSSEKARQMLAEFAFDQTEGLWVEVLMPENAFRLCADLASPKLGVRTLDSLHVACALELKATRFWTFDERQAKLAKAQGLKTN